MPFAGDLDFKIPFGKPFGAHPQRERSGNPCRCRSRVCGNRRATRFAIPARYQHERCCLGNRELDEAPARCFSARAARPMKSSWFFQATVKSRTVNRGGVLIPDVRTPVAVARFRRQTVAPCAADVLNSPTKLGGKESLVIIRVSAVLSL